MTATTPDLIHPFSDAAGQLGGALILRDLPYDNRQQWQAFLDTLLAGLTQNNPQEDIDGTYILTWTGTATDTDDAALILTRDGYGAVAEQLPLIAESNLPTGTLGLIAIITEPEREERLAVLALRGGYIPMADQLRADRILASIVTTTGTPTSTPLSTNARNDFRLLGKLMHKTLDKALLTTLGRS